MRTQIKLLFRDKIHFRNHVITYDALDSIECCFDSIVWDFRFLQYKDLNFL